MNLSCGVSPVVSEVHGSNSTVSKTFIRSYLIGGIGMKEKHQLFGLKAYARLVQRKDHGA